MHININTHLLPYLRYLHIPTHTHTQYISHLHTIHFDTTNNTKQRDFQVHKIALQKRHPPLLTPLTILKPTIPKTSIPLTLDPLIGETTLRGSDPYSRDTFLTLTNRHFPLRFSWSFFGANKIRFNEYPGEPGVIIFFALVTYNTRLASAAELHFSMSLRH